MEEDPKQMLEDIDSSSRCQNGIELSDWEEEFIESIQSRVDEGRGLSDRQLECLKKIWDRV